MLIRNLLYILQSEGYDPRRFLRYTYGHLAWWKLEGRQKLEWTGKIVVLYVVTWILVIGLILMLIKYWGWVGLFCIIILLSVLPCLIVLSLLVVTPVDWILKKIIVGRAKELLKQKNMIKIGITGSYGKTSMKEILGAVLQEKFKVLKTPENINTDIGVARFITKNLRDEEVLIVEMGAYSKGDIINLCELVNPDYSLLTGIAQAHLDRFGSMENIIEAKFELPKRTRKLSLINLDNEIIKSNHQKIDLKNYRGISKKIFSNVQILDNFAGVEFEFDNQKFRCALLAEHNLSLISLAFELARELGLDDEQMKRGLLMMKPVTHRLQPIYNEKADVMILDDNYNANIYGVESALEVLARAKGRKIVITPGPLVEVGDMTEELNNKVGKMYASKVDLVMLIKSSVSKYVLEGMNDEGFDEYKLYDSTLEAHEDLKKILKKGDTILFQNDLADIYL
ncbi:UDP-N-acetylmuramoyl-tripeptide--D-alanyl-D-alanine ligase [Patescibacteria group bacterium]|nr:UDP-N-acetylmuramoyl-tripeptide--D-alanyl-D-alanine ligase [Patescibacteria group bacterium]